MKKNQDKGTVVLSGSTLDLADYWQKKKGFKTRKAFIEAAINRYIDIENHNYYLPDMEIHRINQLITAVNALKDESYLTRKAVNNGFSAILDLDEDDGEL